MNEPGEGLAPEALADEGASAAAAEHEEATVEDLDEVEAGEGEGDGETDDEEVVDPDGDSDEPEPKPEPKKKDDDEAGEGRETGSARWKRRALAAEARLETRRTTSAALATEEGVNAEIARRLGKPPEQKEGEDYLDFESRKTAFELDRRQITREVNAEAERAKDDVTAALREKVEDYQERRTAAVKAIPDYDKVMKAAGSLELSGDLKAEILDSEKGPLLAYHLAKNPDLAGKLNALPPRALAREIGRLEAALNLPTTKATKAPPVVRPVRGASPAKSTDQQIAAWVKRKYG